MRFLAIAILVGAVLPVHAAEPELIPLTPPAFIVPPCQCPSFERPSHMAVWQYYAVDRSGRFRPREPLATEPYQRAMIHSRALIPYIID